MIIDADTFQDNEKLKFVQIAHTRIETLPKYLFRDNLLLEWVSLSNCSIKVTDGSLFETNTKLARVDLSSNKLEHLPSKLFSNNLLLESINFSKNELETIEVDFTQFNFLKKLDLSSNSCINSTYADSDGIKNIVEIQRRIKSNCRPIEDMID